MVILHKKIWQCHRWEFSDIPEYVKNYQNTWINKNPDWEYTYFTHEMCEEMIRSNIGPHHARIYSEISNGHNKADYWRIITIFLHGGLYADLDSKCKIPLSEWLDESVSFCVNSATYEDIGTLWENSCFYSRPQTKELEEVIDIMTDFANKIGAKHMLSYPHFLKPFNDMVNHNKHRSDYELFTTQTFPVYQLNANGRWDNKFFFENQGL